MILFIAGLGALVVGAAIVGIRILRLRAAPPQSALPVEQPTCVEIAARTASGPGLTEASGVAEPGPGGIFTAPMSGTPCVWAYRQVSVRTHLRTANIDRPDSGEGTTNPFVLRDATGTVTIDPAGMAPDTLQPASSAERGHFEQNYPNVSLQWTWRYEALAGHPDQPGPMTLDKEVGRLYEEWTLPAGMHVYVPGTARRIEDGSVVVQAPGSDGKFVVSRRSAQQRAAITATVARIRSGMWIFVVGTLIGAAGLVMLTAGYDQLTR